MNCLKRNIWEKENFFYLFFFFFLFLASRIRKVADVVASGFVSGSSTWRDEIDDLRELNNWDEALDLYKKLAKDKDPSTEILILGQKAQYEKDYDSAKKSYSSIINDDSYSNIIHIEAKALYCIIEYENNTNEHINDYGQNIIDFLSSFNESTLRDPNFTCYRFSILLECLLLKGEHEKEKELEYYHLIEKITLQYYYLNGSLCKKTQNHYEYSVYQKIKLSSNKRLELEEWREALSSPISPSLSHESNILENISKLNIYYFRSDPQYPKTSENYVSSIKNIFSPNSASEEGLYASFLLEKIENKTNITVYDDIIFACGTENVIEHAIGLMENAVAMNTDNLHLWSQFALCLLCGGREIHAFTIVQQILEVTPNDVLMLLLGAKICINHLYDIKTASDYCNKAINICENDPKSGLYLGQSYHYLGLCYSILAPNIYSIDRRNMHQNALEYYQKACISGCDGYLFYFHYALEFAEIGDISKAKNYVKKSLELNEDYVQTWLLFILLLTSQKMYEEALEICNTALIHHNNEKILYCSVIINMKMEQYKQALQIISKLFEMYAKPEDTNKPPSPREQLLSPRGKSLEISDISEPISQYSQRSESTKNTLSKELDINNEHFDLFDTWILLAQLFIHLEKYDDCKSALDEAISINPYHAETLYWQGKLEQIKGNINKAIHFYKDALCCNPNHQESTTELAKLLISTDIHEAENYAISATRKFPFSSSGWLILGKILLDLKDKNTSISCIRLALDIEEKEPLLPYSWIKRSL